MRQGLSRTIFLFITAILVISIACSLSRQDTPTAKTQTARSIEETAIAREFLKLTEAVQATAEAEEQPSDQPAPPTDTPQPPPADTPEPIGPVFTASETMFCRSGPGTAYPDHWTVDEGRSYPVFARWHLNDWLVVELNDPGTRTKCCWIGGNGELNIPISSIQEIDYLPDRITCEKPAQDVKVWDYNNQTYTTLSCGQITQSEWYFCNVGSGEYCTDVNYDDSYDYLVFQPDADAVCNLPGDFFKP